MLITLWGFITINDHHSIILHIKILTSAATETPSATLIHWLTEVPVAIFTLMPNRLDQWAQVLHQSKLLEVASGQTFSRSSLQKLIFFTSIEHITESISGRHFKLVLMTCFNITDRNPLSVSLMISSQYTCMYYPYYSKSNVTTSPLHWKIL